MDGKQSPGFNSDSTHHQVLLQFLMCDFIHLAHPRLIGHSNLRLRAMSWKDAAAPIELDDEVQAGFVDAMQQVCVGSIEATYVSSPSAAEVDLPTYRYLFTDPNDVTATSDVNVQDINVVPQSFRQLHRVLSASQGVF